jgi:hypothetical protein
MEKHTNFHVLGGTEPTISVLVRSKALELNPNRVQCLLPFSYVSEFCGLFAPASCPAFDVVSALAASLALNLIWQLSIIGTLELRCP